ncbi:MAG: GTP-binding protein [Chloroflexota bacterium]|nr:GTP-binding protein [Chloroflexota bacterium]
MRGAHDLVRFATVGSVDDGKSTLIGRLLLDTHSAYEDQVRAMEHASRARGDEYTDLALLTDGLRAEREQGITIDVAYRYFSTSRRSFIIADCPGHIEYTRNMVCGVSTADVALLLVDARLGVLEQTKRHAFIASLLGVSHLTVCINKMDLVDYSESAYERIASEFTDFVTRLRFGDVTLIPVSALHGDNVFDRSDRMPWYAGPPLLYHLEHVHVASDRDLVDVRFPVQMVVRPRSSSHPDYRAYAGQVVGGVLRTGDDVVVLPSGTESRIASIETHDGPVVEAFPPMSVSLRLTEHLDVSRGDLIARPHNRPRVVSEFEAMLCCLWDTELVPDRPYGIRHTTRTSRAIINSVRYRVDVETLHRDTKATSLRQNEIGRVQLRLTAPLFVDPYSKNRAMGSFLLVDLTDGSTVAAGLVLDRGA